MDGKSPQGNIRIEENGVEKDLSLTLVFADGNKRLHMQDLRARGVSSPNPVAMWAGVNEAVIDTRAYEILKKECGTDREKLESYLRAILNFELQSSGDFERHENRTPVEKEILTILKDRGYFIS